MTLAMLHQLVKYNGLENVENELNAIADKGFDERYVELYEDMMKRSSGFNKHSGDMVSINSYVMIEFLGLEEAIQKLKDYEHNRQPTKKPTYETANLCFVRHNLRGLQHKLNEVLQDIEKAQAMIDGNDKVDDQTQDLLAKATKHSKKAKSNVEAVFSMLNKD